LILIPSRPSLTLDVSPLLEAQWTGIPVFTRRLAQALVRHGGVDVHFMSRLTPLRPSAVMRAIRASNGIALREQYETDVSTEPGIIDCASHLLFPTVKESFNLADHEASTIHDVSTLLMPECHEEANVAFHLDHLAEQVATDDTTFCISEATRVALHAAFPSIVGKTRLLTQYVDWPDDYLTMERNLPSLRLGPFAVVVGTIEPRKNLGLLLRALHLPEVQRSQLRFVVVGRKGWMVDQLLAELPPAAKERILFSGFVSEFTKYRLIRAAEFLIFPSIYEGFGIPALEALSLGKPVLASRSSSLPEVVQEAGVFFDPFSVTDFADAISAISHPQKLAELAPLALANAAAFDWQRMATPVVEWATL
jgi:glycosyltransferase involved in cell wall biosynthesis